MNQPLPDKSALCTRRDLLKATGALTMGTLLASRLPAAEPVHQPASLIRIGIHLTSFQRPTLEARFDAVKQCGLDCVQMNMSYAGLPMMPDAIDPDFARQIRRQAEARGISIGSMQGTFNMCHPDPEYRRSGVRKLRAVASTCRLFGTSIIHICTGTRNRDDMWRRHPDNGRPEAWRDMIACMRDAVVVAKESNVILAFEPEVNNIVDSDLKARRLLDEIASPHLKVAMDAANLFHAGELSRMREILDRAFELLGKDIILAHAKDVSHDGDAGHEPAGHGKLDYDRYLALLYANGFRGPLMLHSLTESQVPGCVAFLRGKLARLASTRPRPS